ncbi:MAG: hypothetical protein JWL90_748 [Chthoniobacteraceae bacterium]|nr:hypothetical protein [Chthoniobacteraceae bacterium]
MPRIFPLCFTLLLSIFVTVSARAIEVRIGSKGINAAVIEAIKAMPLEGTYAATSVAQQALAGAITRIPGGLAINAQSACPSFCSSATYLVFVRTLQELAADGALQLDNKTLDALLVHGQRDGEGAWGRWNANGPGTARLFSELDLGPNFTSFDQALPGDFMKIFWTSEIGARERGHSVIYLGTETVAGVEQIRFWSSNQPRGYGIKSVPRSKIVRAIFSRLERPANLSRLGAIPSTDAYLASLLKVRSTPLQMGEKCNLLEERVKIGPVSR